VATVARSSGGSARTLGGILRLKEKWRHPSARIFPLLIFLSSIFLSHFLPRPEQRLIGMMLIYRF
jgi:hypothetical protein